MSLARAEWAMALDEQSRKKQMQKTNIEWTDLSWNPGSGCDKVSPGCKIVMPRQSPPVSKALGLFRTDSSLPFTESVSGNRSLGRNRRESLLIQ
jgi:hypothetical protein